MKRRRKTIRGLQNDDRGTALLELAVVLPVLLTIGLGVLEFGNMIYRKHLIINGVRDAARYVSGLPYDAANTSQTAATITKGQNIAATGQASGGSNRISCFRSSLPLT